jgi:hypothetical protein
MLDSSVLVKFISTSRVVHRLPGRIRIHIPILERLPIGWSTYSEHTAELIKLRKGVKDVEIQPGTGSLLIHYDPDRIAEADILKWLKTLVETFLNIEIPSKSMNEADIRLRFARVRDSFMRNGAAQYPKRGSFR